MNKTELKICENCKFYHNITPYVEVDLFMNQRKRRGGRYCKWLGTRIKKKAPACRIFKLFEDQDSVS